MIKSLPAALTKYISIYVFGIKCGIYPGWIRIVGIGAAIANRLISMILWHYTTPTHSCFCSPSLSVSLSFSLYFSLSLAQDVYYVRLFMTHKINN